MHRDMIGFSIAFAQFLCISWSLPLQSDQDLQYISFDIDELKETFGVTHHSAVPQHKLVWPNIETTIDHQGNPIINRLLLDTDDQSISIPLTLIPDPVADKKCHYQSTHDPDTNIQAAISNCDDQLRGTIITDTQVFTLHPLPKARQKYGKSNTTLKTHVLVKRQTLITPEESVKTDFCGIESDDTAISSIARDSPLWANLGSNARRVSQDTEMTIEIAIFVDNEMWKRYWSQHGSEADSKLQDFVATVFNNIQILYAHPTMSYKMNFKIVKYDVFKTQPDSIGGHRHREGDAQMYLDTFCMYQYGLSGRTWDQAFLFTGYDIHRNYGVDKSISGIARLYGACDPYNSCVLVEGHDFTSVYIATHEIGHGFGMRHDEPYCSSTFIMSGSLGPGKVTWSSCSMNDMGKYIDKLDNNGKNCLRQTNGYSAVTIDMSQLPGQRYNADQQCALMHGAGYSHVMPRSQYREGACYMMWCGLNGYGRIITAHPALEGTVCGNGLYCLKGQCTQWQSGPSQVPTNQAQPRQSPPRSVDGGWSDWTRQSCSACVCSPFTGALGIHQNTRTCSNPTPNGGRDCVGDMVRGTVCNSNCPATGDTVDAYIDRQCQYRQSQGNDPEMTGNGAQLLRFEGRACKVFCEIRSSVNGKNYRFYGDLVPDGTPCARGKYCVAGQCLALACENSALVNDPASCPSNYEKCTTVPNVFQVLPTQAVISTSSVAVAPDWSLWTSWSACTASCENGIQVRYRSCNNPSKCSGSADEKRACNNGPCDNRLRSNDDPAWSTWTSWTSCSATCGEGSQTRIRRCTGRCRSDTFEPSREIRSCYNKACSQWGSWGVWSECYDSTVSQTRLRNCYGEGRCPGQRSDSVQDRQQKPCPKYTGSWGAWSSCSRTCGGGIRNRYRTCNDACTSGENTQQEECSKQECPNTRFGRGVVQSRFSNRMIVRRLRNYIRT